MRDGRDKPGRSLRIDGCRFATWPVGSFGGRRVRSCRCSREPRARRAGVVRARRARRRDRRRALLRPAAPPRHRGHPEGPVEFRPFWLTALFLLALRAGVVGGVVVATPLARPAGHRLPGHRRRLGRDHRGAREGRASASRTRRSFSSLGEFPSGFESLFRTLPNGLTVAGGSAPGSPIRAFANRDGITSPSPAQSLLGIQGWVGDGGGERAGGGGSMMQSVGIGASIGIDQSVGISIGGSVIGSVGVGGPLQEIQRIIRRARDENRPLTEDEKRRVRSFRAVGRAGAGCKTGGRDLPGGRARRSCRMRGWSRKPTRGSITSAGSSPQRGWPLCPLNGAVLAVPAVVSDRDDAAQQWGLVAREDLARGGSGVPTALPGLHARGRRGDAAGRVDVLRALRRREGRASGWARVSR